MSLLDFKALTFDCYGTLIDWETGILEALRATLPGLDKPESEVLETFARVESEEEAASPNLAYPRILARVYARLAKRWRLDTTAEKARAFGASVGDWPAFEDSTSALRRLQKHYRLVILSNIDRESFAKSRERLGIDFDLVLTAEEIGSYKPDPRNFDFMLQRMESEGVGKEKILHTAQSLFHDHLPASQLGLTTCWIDRRHQNPGWGATPEPSKTVEVDYRFNSLAEMAEAVERAATVG